MTEEALAWNLHCQVTKAAQGHEYRHVTTYITRPMWQAFLRGIGIPDTDEPNEDPCFDKARRVAGSRTVVVDKPGMWAISRLTSC